MYHYENELKEVLTKYDSIKSEIAVLEKQKNDIREKVKKWLELNKINTQVEITGPNKIWVIQTIKTKRKSVINYEVLLHFLGEEAPTFIKESTSESIRID